MLQTRPTASPDQDRANPGRGRGWRTRLPWLLPAIAIAILSSPLILTGRTYGWDWSSRLWLVAAQAHSIKQQWLPSYFINFDFADKAQQRFPVIGRVFEPHFAFYGGTMYAIAGLLAVVVGPVGAYVLSWMGGLAMLYGGASWTSLQLGLRGWTAQLPGLVLVTSPYVLTCMYARGAWNEFMATSAIPLMVASGLWLLRHDRWKVLPAAALLLATIIWAGSHGITLIWGGLTLISLTLVAGVVYWPRVRQIGLRRVAAVAGVCVLGASVSAWFLFPMVAYQRRTEAGALVQSTGQAVSSNLKEWIFSWLPYSPPNLDPQMSLTFPVAEAGWVLAVGLVLLGIGKLGRRAAVWLVVLVAWAGGMLLLMLQGSPWLHIPAPLNYLQFSYRLETYALFALAAAVGLLLFGLARSDAILRIPLNALLVCLLVLMLAAGTWRIWHTPSQTQLPSPTPELTFSETRSQVAGSPTSRPSTEYSPSAFSDITEPTAPKGYPLIEIKPSDVRGSHFEGDFELPPGTRYVNTNISGGPYLVAVEGATYFGRDMDHYQVLEVPPGTTRLHLVVHTATTLPVVTGKIVTWLSIAGALALLVSIGMGNRRRRRRQPAAPDAAAEATQPASA